MFQREMGDEGGDADTERSMRCWTVLRSLDAQVRVKLESHVVEVSVKGALLRMYAQGN